MTPHLRPAGLALVVVTAALVAAQGPPSARPPTPPPARLTIDGVTEVPVARGKRSGWWYVSGKVNGDPVTFVLDTGAPYNVLDKGAARRLGYEAGDGRTIDLAGGATMTVHRDVSARVKVGPWPATEETFTILAMDAVWGTVPGDGPEASDGLLGVPFLTRFGAVLDFAAGKLYLSGPGKARTAPDCIPPAID